MQPSVVVLPVVLESCNGGSAGAALLICYLFRVDDTSRALYLDHQQVRCCALEHYIALYKPCSYGSGFRSRASSVSCSSSIVRPAYSNSVGFLGNSACDAASDARDTCELRRNNAKIVAIVPVKSLHGRSFQTSNLTSLHSILA